MLLLYKIGEYNDVIEFLTGIAKSRGKIKKGGIVDLTSSARLVLQDWNEGKIKYYSIPPLGEGEIEMEWNIYLT